MENWLKVKTAGLPRWAWVALLSGGVVLGLYLRSRSASNEAEGESEEYPAEGELVEGGLGGYGEGGLAGAGLIGPAGGSTSVPVQTPYIPEGFTSAFSTLVEQLGSDNTEFAGITKFAIEHPQTNTVIETIREAGGGGPPEPGFHEALPTPSTPGTTPKPTPSCSQGDINILRSNKSNIDRLQAEINQYQNNINQHPNAKDVNSWRANIQNKREKVNQLSSQNQQIRNKPGCGNVQV